MSNVNISAPSKAAKAVLADSATNLKGGTAGNIPYQLATNQTVFTTGNTNGKILKVAAGNPTWSDNSVTVLGNGTFSNSHDGIYEDIGNFATSADIAQGIIFLDFFIRRQSGAGTAIIGLDNVSGDSSKITLNFGANAGSGGYVYRCQFRKSVDGSFTSRIDCVDKATVTTISPAGTNVVEIRIATNSSDFDFSSAEQVFLKIKNDTAATVFNMEWMAYLIK